MAELSEYWKIHKKMKNEGFFNMWHFIFGIENLIIVFAKKLVFAFQVLNRSVHGRLTPILMYQSEGAKGY